MIFITETFALKGAVCYSIDKTTLEQFEKAYVICKDGKSLGVFKELPKQFKSIPVLDYSDSLIIPGLVDLHAHASQYAFRSLGMDLELLEWLEARPFKEEAKFEDTRYGYKAYEIFVDDLKKSSITRTCLFATIHVGSTMLLMDLLERSGLIAYVGKVNMDRNSPPQLIEGSAEESIRDTVFWLESSTKYKNVKPILTPRFYPSCSEAIMEQLGIMQKKYNIPLQTHLAENLSEIEWVKQLNPKANTYSEAYELFDLFGSNGPALMAHCVYLSRSELDLIKNRDVTIAHCPQSNTCLSSGIAPVRKFLDENISVGLGTDIAAGYYLSIFKMMAEAIQVSKLYWRLQKNSCKPLTIEEAFFLGTKGGGAFFGKVGSFEPEYEFDAVVINDSSIRTSIELTVKQRLERIIYLSDDRDIVGKFVKGVKLF